MNTIWVYQFADDHFKAIKFLRGRHELAAIESGALSSNLPDTGKGHIIICLPRHKLTLRYLKNVPAQSPREIESIVALQAPQLLPYPAQELITAYQVVSCDKQGYSGVNLVIAHKETVEHCLGMFPRPDGRALSVVASSWGLLNYYNYLRPHDHETTIIVDADCRQPELAVVQGDKLLFSRSLRINMAVPSWQDGFVDEVNISRDAFLKETGLTPPAKLVVVGTGPVLKESRSALERKTGLAVSVLSTDKLKFAPGLSDKLDAEGNSFAALIGLAIKASPASMDLLPAELKAKKSRSAGKKELLRMSLSACAIIFVLCLGFARNLDNKARYLGLLKARLNSISAEAGPLEEMEKRLQTLESRGQKGFSGLEELHELYRVMPPQAALTVFGYDESGRATIQGQSPELNAVFGLAAELEKSAVFSGFSVKVQYATKKVVASGEIVDFEIICLRQE
ncbi:MAG: hypothetical protein Q8O22_06835 [Candidatus Omnitrophota bacterium]|nr:hypothetical protein [Candidatus Omnitrophota bacterium]